VGVADLYLVPFVIVKVLGVPGFSGCLWEHRCQGSFLLWSLSRPLGFGDGCRYQIGR
jgi:hypothetical protein